MFNEHSYIIKKKYLFNIKYAYEAVLTVKYIYIM